MIIYILSFPWDRFKEKENLPIQEKKKNTSIGSIKYLLSSLSYAIGEFLLGKSLQSVSIDWTGIFYFASFLGYNFEAINICFSV